MASRIEAATPLALIGAERVARAEPDGANLYIAVVDQPVFLTGIRIAAAGEGGLSMVNTCPIP